METGVYETYSPPKPMTVQEIIDELGLKDCHWGILINGKDVALDTTVGKDDKLIILPQIAGG